jgi:hypothetical protein
MTVISDSLVLSDEVIMEPKFGRLCWVNYMRTADVTITSETDEHPATNVVNPSSAFYWQASSTAQQDISIQVGREIDYIGIVRHNFGPNSEIKIAIRIGTHDLTLWNWRPPPSGQVQLFLFNRWYADEVVVSIRYNDVPPLLGVVYAGLSTILQRKIYVGHTPITLGRNVTTVGGYSENGQYLGELIRREGRSTNLSLQNLTPEWYRDQLDPFIAQRPRFPAFFAWRPGQYSAEVGYVWLKGSPRPVNQRSNGMMSIDIEFEGMT